MGEGRGGMMLGATSANTLFLLSLLSVAASIVTAQDSTWVQGTECAKSLLFQQSRAQDYSTYKHTTIQAIPAQDAVQGPGAPRPVTLYTASPNSLQKRIYQVTVIGDEFFWCENTGNTSDRFQDAWHFYSGSVSAGDVTPTTAGRLSPAVYFTYSRWDYPESVLFAVDNSAEKEGAVGKRYVITTGDLDGIKVVANWFPDKVKLLDNSGVVRIDTTVTPVMLYFTDRTLNTSSGVYHKSIERAPLYGNRTRLGGVQTIYKGVEHGYEPIEQMQLDTVNRRLFVLHINYNRQRSQLAVHDISVNPPTLVFKRPINHDYVKYFKIDVYSSPPVLYALVLGQSLYKAHLVALDGTDMGASNDTIIVGPKLQIAYASLNYFNVYSNFDIYYDPECVAALAPATSE
eukprot:jgi/Chlat1/4834/Chrsp31S08936